VIVGMKKTVFIFLILALLSISAVSALTFETSITAVKSKIYLNEEAIFTLMLRNDLPTIENFLIYSTEVTWSISADPPGARNPKLYPETNTFINLKLKPTSYITPGFYIVPISVKNPETRELRVVSAGVEILSTEPFGGQYLPGIRTEVEVPGKVDPREELLVKVNLINQNQLNISQLLITLRSSLIKKEYTTSLDPLETKTVNFNINLEDLTEPQRDIIYTTIKVGPHAFEPEPNIYDVLSYGEVKETRDVKRGFFKTVKSLQLENTGNARLEHTTRIPYGFFTSLFTRASPKGKRTTFEGSRHLAWTVTVEPGSTTAIKITTNYQFLIFALVLIVIITVSYYTFRSPVVIQKSAIITGRKHGGISQLSVRMNVVNRGKVNANNLVITDKLPNLVDLLKEFEEGTLRPSSILRHEKKGTIIKWNVNQLEPGEERIIHYKVKTRLSILGSLTLPVTIANFSCEGAKKPKVAGSNRLNIRA
jgi:hypothetical protein